MSWSKSQMAKEVIKLIPAHSSVNLGIGIPTLVAENTTPDRPFMIHSENGVLGVEGRPTKETLSPTLINAGKETISISKGASFFDSSLSFGMIRGGHIDFCILGGMQVDTNASLANWMVPGKKINGMGGAMDLVNGAKNVIIMMKHFDKDNKSKLIKTCDLPLTGYNVVDLVVTELGIFKPTKNMFEIVKLADGITRDDLILKDIFS